MFRKPTLHQSLPPVIAVDPGQAATAIVVRVGTEAVAACIVLNPEPAKTEIGAHARNLSPEYGYLAAIRAAITQFAHEHGPAARDYWHAQGHPVPDDTPVWLLAVEKVNYPSLLPGRTVTECETGSVFAPKGIAEHIAGWWGPHRVIWVCPFHCDDRWEPRHGGTGNPFDYFPARLLVGYTSDTDGTYPSMDDPRFRHARIKDACAAWSIGSDAATDYARRSRARYGSVLPPHLATGVHQDLLDGLRAYWEKRIGGPLPKPQVIVL